MQTVSILTHPEGRVLLLSELPHKMSGGFQSSPAPKGGCCAQSPLHSPARHLVSILIRPEGRVLRTTSHTHPVCNVGSNALPTRPAAAQELAGPYDRNIQIAELNALNAALSVVKWKKMLGFYLDFESETNALYQIDSNVIIHEKLE